MAAADDIEQKGSLRFVAVDRGEPIRVGKFRRSSEFSHTGLGAADVHIFGDALVVHGWVVGTDRRPTGVEVWSDDSERLGVVPVGLERPDVVHAVGDLPGAARSGFAVTMRPSRSGSSEISLRVVFDEASPVLLGVFTATSAVGPPASDEKPPWLFSEQAFDRRLVLEGQGDWLFLQGDRNDSIGQLTGKRAFTEQDKEVLRGQLRRRKQIAHDAGATWLTAVVPDKEVVYREHLPTDITPVERRPIHEYLDVASSVDAPVIYLLKDIEEEKSGGDLYVRTDTHWNHKGAFVAYQAVCRELKLLGREINQIEEDAITWWGAPTQGDLGAKLYPDVVESEELRAKTLNPKSRLVYDNRVRNHGCVLIYEQDVDAAPSCLVFGESFADAPLIFLRESFSRLVFVHTSMFIPDLIQIEAPDVVLNLPIERFLIDIPDDLDAFEKLRESAHSKGGELPWTSVAPTS